MSTIFFFHEKKLNQNQSNKKIYFVRGLRPQAPDAFGLNSPSQLVIGYHWLSLLNRENRQILKNIKLRKHYLHTFQNIVHLLGQTKYDQFW